MLIQWNSISSYPGFEQLQALTSLAITSYRKPLFITDDFGSKRSDNAGNARIVRAVCALSEADTNALHGHVYRLADEAGDVDDPTNTDWGRENAFMNFQRLEQALQALQPAEA